MVGAVVGGVAFVIGEETAVDEAGGRDAIDLVEQIIIDQRAISEKGGHRSPEGRSVIQVGSRGLAEGEVGTGSSVMEVEYDTNTIGVE